MYLTDGDAWTTGWTDTFGAQHAIVGDDATSILCVTVAGATEAERCAFEDDGETFELVMMEATYEPASRSARATRGPPKATFRASSMPSSAEPHGR